jgi:hypothetical protein
MTTKTNLSATVRGNIPYIIHQSEAPMNKKELRDAYVLQEGCSSEFDFGVNKDTWSKLRSAIHGACPKLVKQGILFQPSKGKFDIAPGTNIPSDFVPFLNGLKPVVIEPTPQKVVEPTPVEVSVDNPAVLEAYIDTETQELVENVGGSRDYRKPLDQVDDGYITSSSVEVSTTTLMSVEEVAEEVVQEELAEEVQEELAEEVQEEEVQEELEEEELEAKLEAEIEKAYGEAIGFSEEVNLTDLYTGPVEVVTEVEVAPVEPVEVVEVVEPTVEEEMPVEADMETQEDTQPSYDLRELRKSASFDPLTITLKKGAKGSYEVYRDMEARMVVLTQKGREDYVIIPVDVDQDRLDALNEIDKRYAPFALKSINDFDSAQHHKDGCKRIVTALISCVHNCDHTDDFGGLAEACPKPLDCPLQSVWGGEAIYVNPKDA